MRYSYCVGRPLHSLRAGPLQMMCGAEPIWWHAGGCLGCHTADKKNSRAISGRACSQDSLLAPFTAPTSRLTGKRGRGAWTEAPVHAAPCDTGSGRTEATTSGPFRTHRLPKYRMQIFTTCGPTCGLATQQQAQSAARSAFSLWFSLCRVGLEMACFSARDVYSQSAGQRLRRPGRLWCRPWATAANATRRETSWVARSQAEPSPWQRARGQDRRELHANRPEEMERR